MVWLTAILAWFIPDSRADCYGCGLDRQWVGSLPDDHACDKGR